MTDLAQRIAELSPEKLELLLRQTQGRSGETDGGIVRRNDPAAPARLSFSQQRLWFLDRIDPGNALYNMHAAFRVRGRLDVETLATSFQQVLDRHGVLRTRFEMIGEEPRQRMTEGMRLRLSRIDLSDWPAEERTAELLRILGEEARWSFDLGAGPLVRVVLVELAEQEWAVSVVLHHAVADGWSIGILIREVSELYAAALERRSPVLPALPIQFADFAEWQREQLQGERLAQQLAWWREHLAGAVPVLDLVTDRPRPPVRSTRGGEERYRFPGDLVQRLEVLAAGCGATLYMTVLALYQVLLWRYSGQTDVLVGSPVAGRDLVETEDLIGPFVNTVVRRTDLGGSPGFAELVVRVKTATLAADAHSSLPFEKLVEELRPERSPNHSPIFQVWLVLHNTPLEPPALPGATIEPFDVHGGTSKFDLTLQLLQSGHGLDAELEYDSDLFDAATVRHLLRQLESLGESAAADPARAIGLLSMLSATEQGELMTARRGRASSEPEHEADLGALLAAAGAPAALAVECEGNVLSYQELDHQSTRLARRLRALGVGPGVLVGLCLPRSTDLVVALVAILKAGGACVPIDPSLPEERIELLLEDTGLAVLVTIDDVLYQLPPAAAACDLVCLDSDQAAIASESTEPLAIGAAPTAPAYVIYTSGSTGKPKGVVVPRGAALAHFSAARRGFGLSAADRVLQFASLSFDVAFEQIFATLGGGAALVLRQAEVWSLAELAEKVVSAGLTVVNLPTAFWQHWAREAAGSATAQGGVLRLVIAGGDAMSPEAARAWHASPLGAVELLNAYGPTEGVITATLFAVAGAESATAAPARVPLGEPLGGRALYLLDGAGRPVPRCVPAEIFLADPFLATGYLGRPAATAASFLPSPWAELPGSRLYRTGDLGRWRADGLLEHFGRRDHQVKVRGFRIELGEIEDALRRYRKVRDVAVVVHGGGAEDKRLVAFLEPVREDEKPSASELREFLADSLPAAIIPSEYAVLARLPHTAGGKIDRRALAEGYETGGAQGAEKIAPRNAVEVELVRIWSEVLAAPTLGVDENFFDLGGHSLLATQVISRVYRSFGVDLPLQGLFMAPTVAGLAALVEKALQESGGSRAPAIERVSREGQLPLSFAQQRLWLFEQITPGTPAYNVPAAFDIAGQLDVAALHCGFEETVRRHEALRTTFRLADGHPVQVIAPAVAVGLPICDLSGLAPGLRSRELARLAGAAARRPFDLAVGPLLRILLVRLESEKHTLLMTLHHIISDGWSVGVFAREVVSLYRTLVSGGAVSREGLGVQYVDYAAWQRKSLDSETMERHLAYWRRQLAGLRVLELPADRPRPLVQGHRGARRSFGLDTELSAALRRLAQDEQATIFMVLLAAFQALLCRTTSQEDIAVGTAVANRNRTELEPLIGFFVNMLVLRTHLAGNPTFRELLARVRRVVLDGFEHQDAPFDQLVVELGSERAHSRNPLFQVVLALQSAPARLPELPGLTIEARRIDDGTSHFDLMMEVVDSEPQLRGIVEYDTDLFEPVTIARLLEHFEQLLREVTADPELRLLEIPLDGSTVAVPEVAAQALYGNTEFNFDPRP